MKTELLELKNLAISFQRFNGKISREKITPVSDISLTINKGEIVALIGASGAGKSLLAHGLLGLLPQNASMSGSCFFKGKRLTQQCFQKLRGKHIALIPQSVNYLNPLVTIKKQVYRSARLSGRCCCTANESCDDAFTRYHLSNEVKQYFPFQISGGMARRVLTATATAGMADLIIADEPTTGLDQRVTEQSLNHLKELANDGKGILFITHDLNSAARIADTIAVVYEGTTMEMLPTGMLNTPAALHPYTRALWAALPQNDFKPLPPKKVSDTAHDRQGCKFAPRCSEATEQCANNMLPLLLQKNNHLTRCIHASG